MGFTKESMEAAKKEMGKMYALSMVGALVMAYVLAHFVDYTASTTITMGALLTMWV